ncbi:hypothetical protein B0H19DRAFT_1257510 [Mycena capillaripes]|nr:hypothetical protein B0H19DRAFT_1257510 [Mycena capillaripes]
MGDLSLLLPHYINFSNITVAEAHEIIRHNRLPRILPKNSIQRWVYDRFEPDAVLETILTANEAAPCLDNMLSITQQMEAAFYEQGARSVCLQLGNDYFRYHLSKIRLVMNVNNHAPNLGAASDILSRVVSSSLLLPEHIEEFKHTKFAEPLAGFHSTQTPLYTLGCLLNERWIIEVVLNAQAELSYFRRAAQSIYREPDFLFLPTSFISGTSFSSLLVSWK